MIFQRASFYYVTITVWLIMDSTVEAYRSGCGGGYCFIISDYNDSNERIDQSAAQQQCRSNGTQLAEIRNRDIQNSTINFIKTVYSPGLNGWNVLTNGKRSSGGWTRLTGNGTSLKVYEQPVISDAYGYLKSTSSGFDLFASKPADNESGFICTGLSNCSGGVTISGHCYKSFTETLSWYDARNRCLDAGGDLASFDHITTNAGFNALNGSWISASINYWIGIRREWWIWQNTSSDVKYSEWITGHPINSGNNIDCLCLSTTQWKWTECGCSEKLPFVCIAVNDSTTSSTTTTSTETATTPTSTSTTTRSSTFTTRSTTTASITKTTSKATSRVTSESGGVSSPAIPATVTSNYTAAGNDTENLDQPVGLSREATIGIGVGVAVGGALLLSALIAAVIILCRKRCPIRCPRTKKTDPKERPPPILTQDSKNNDLSSDGMENPYALVVSSSPKWNNANTNSYENSNDTSIIYAQLGFDKEPQSQRDGSVIIVPGKTKPSTLPKPPATKNVAKRVNVDDDMNAEATTA